MRDHVWLVMVVAFGVDSLLLLASIRLSGELGDGRRIALGAILSSIYTGLCVYFGRMSGGWERLACLLLVAVVAFGMKKKSALPAVIYLLLNMVALILAKGIGDGYGAVASTLLGAVCLIRGERSERTVPVRLRYGAQELNIRALMDTGNCLQDPLTGDSVLVLGAEAAKILLGLELQQLQDPINTVAEGAVRGLRLIPYQTIGGKGLLLALRIADVQIGGRRGSKVVAFAPCALNNGNGFHGLTGGIA